MALRLDGRFVGGQQGGESFEGPRTGGAGFQGAGPDGDDVPAEGLEFALDAEVAVAVGGVPGRKVGNTCSFQFSRPLKTRRSGRGMEDRSRSPPDLHP